MRFLLFLFSYAINPAIILAIPDKDVSGFLYNYAASSAIFSFILLIYFSNAWAVKKVAYFVPAASCILISFVALFGKNWLWVYYPYSILIGDYITTQSGSERLSNAYRVLLVASAVPIVLFPQHFYELVAFRSGINTLYALALITKIRTYHVLNIKSPVKWILITYIFYSGSLLLAPQISHNDPATTKAWFIGIQIGIGLLLKKLDFSARAINNNPTRIYLALDVAVFAGPFVLTYFYRNYYLLALYIISALAIRSLEYDKPPSKQVQKI